MKREDYEQNPKKCKMCGMNIPFKKKIKEAKYCNLECSQKHLNKLKYPVSMKRNTICINCDKNFESYNDDRKYCSNECSSEYRNKENIEQWKQGNVIGYTGKNKQLKKFVRIYLHKSRGTACSICGWDEKHPIDGLPLTEIDHIDGNADNCTESNLRILCPNCHAMTPTHRARNKNSARTSRYLK